METQTNGQKNQNFQPKPSAMAAFGLFVWDLVKILAVAVIIIVPFRMFVAEPFMVSGSSMVPNFYDKDYLIIDRLSYHLHSPGRGDVVVLKFPKDTSQYYIKRIIGLPGEEISCQQGKVVVFQPNTDQRQVLIENYLPANIETNNCKPLQTLGSNEYFVLGDNRVASSDSRVWGILPSDDIVGKVWLRAFPLNNLKFFQEPSYTQ